MFDAEDAGAERPREMAFLGRLPLLCVVGMDMLQHQGRQTLMHIWVELRTTGRRHLSLSDCAVALFFVNHEKQRLIKIDSKFGKRTTEVTKRNQKQKAKNLTLSDVWFFYGTDITLEDYQSRMMVGSAESGLVRIMSQSRHPVKAYSTWWQNKNQGRQRNKKNKIFHSHSLIHSISGEIPSPSALDTYTHTEHRRTKKSRERETHTTNDSSCQRQRFSSPIHFS